MAGQVNSVFNAKQVEESAAFLKLSMKNAMTQASEALFSTASIAKLEKALHGLESKLSKEQAIRNTLHAKASRLTTEEIGKVQTKYQKEMNEANKRGAKEIEAASKKSAAEQVDAKTKAEDYLATVKEKHAKDLARVELGAIDANDRSKAKFDADRADERVKSLQDEMKTEMGNVDKVSKKWEASRKKFGDKWASMMSDGAESFGEGIHSAFENIKSKDVGALGKLFKSMGGAASKGGTAMGGEEKGGIAKLLSQLGPLLTGIGAVALGFAALVKVVLDADSRIKELNKEILGAGVAGQDFGDNIELSMKKVRDAFSDISYLEEFGSTTKENITIMNAFQKAGVAYEELVVDIDNQKDATLRLQEANKGAIVYAKLLGENAETVATNMATMAKETGGTLEGVRDRYHEIAAAAKQSGFDTKRFYGMVLEMTSGMSMYNVRLQDTLGLLSKAGKVLGPDAGKAWAQSLKGDRGASTQETLVRAMKMGKGEVQGAAKLDAKFQAESLQTSFKEIQKGPNKEASAQLTKALERAGLNTEMSPEKLAEAMGKMSTDKADILRADLNDVKGQSGLGTKTAHAQMVARAGEGLGGMGGQVNAMQNFGMAGTLMTKIRGAHEAAGGRTDFDKLDTEDVVGKIAAENLNGAITPEDTDMLRNAIGQLKREGKAVTMDGIMEKLLDVQQTAAKEAKDAEKEAKDKAEKEAKDKAAAWEEDQERAKDLSRATHSMADTMENVIEQLLTSISESINSLVSWFLGGQGEDDKKGKAEAIEKLTSENEALSEKNTALEGNTPEVKAERATIAAKQKTNRQTIRYIGRDQGKGKAEDFNRRAQLNQLSPEEQAAVGQKKKDLARSRDANVEPTIGEMEFFSKGEITKKEATAIETEALKAHETRNKKVDDDRSTKEVKSLGDMWENSMMKYVEAEAIVKAVQKAGGTMTPAMASEIVSSGNIPDDAKKYSTEIRQAVGPKTAQVRDAMLTVEKGGKRGVIGIDDKDSVSIHKPGGGLSNRGGGGGTVNNYYIYDGGQALSTITKAQNAGVIP